MSRDLLPAASAAVRGEVVCRTVAVRLDFAGGAVRLNGSLASILIDGEEFPGVGSLLGVSAIDETWELQNSGMSVSLSGIPRDMINIALTEPYQNRPATVWEVLLDRETGAPIAAPAIVFRGRMDQMNVSLGELASVQITIEDLLTELDRPNLARFTDEDQRRAFPSDGALRFVSATAEREIIWPSRSFR